VSVTVLTAIGDPRREAELAAGLHDVDLGVTVVRRCVDIADLLAAGSAGLAQAVLLSADLRRLDRTAVQRLRQAGLAVVAIAPDDVGARDRLRRIGIETVIADSAPAAGVAAAVVSAVSGPGAPPAPAAVYPSGPAVPVGRLVAVWGAVGAPGRSSVAVNLAAELAGLGHPTLCVDLDTYGASLAQLVGLLDDGSGIAAACRAANAGTLDAAALRGLAAEVRPRLRMLTGITGPHRWPELRAASLDVVLDRAKQAFRYVVVDVGFCVELDEELSYDTVAPRRNGAAVDVLKAADLVVAVASADPIGIARFVRAVADLPRGASGSELVTVINRVRRAAIGRGDPAQQIALALGRYADIAESVMVPDDAAMADAAVATGRTWSEVAPTSAARMAVRKLAGQIAGNSMATTRPRRRLLQIRT
jgi:MinD-like ATPase involved in chromosome partitioning or flagellar assembly